jgi:hypothetical protein
VVKAGVADGYHTVVVKSGTAWAWGTPANRQRDVAARYRSVDPVSIGLTGVVAVRRQRQHCRGQELRTVWAWGTTTLPARRRDDGRG